MGIRKQDGNKQRQDGTLPALLARLCALSLQTIAGPSVVSRRRMGARRTGTDGQASTGTSSCLMGACCQTSPHLLAAPPPHTQLLKIVVLALRGQGTPRQGLVLRDARFSRPTLPPHLQVMGDAWRGTHSLSPRQRSLPPPTPQPLNPLCAQQPEFMGSFKNKSLKRLSLASRILQERLNKTTQRQKMLSMASPLGVKPPHFTPHLLWGSHVREERGSHWE